MKANKARRLQQDRQKFNIPAECPVPHESYGTYGNGSYQIAEKSPGLEREGGENKEEKHASWVYTSHLDQTWTVKQGIGHICKSKIVSKGICFIQHSFDSYPLR